jgi:hypothetical protein
MHEEIMQSNKTVNYARRHIVSPICCLPNSGPALGRGMVCGRPGPQIVGGPLMVYIYTCSSAKNKK